MNNKYNNEFALVQVDCDSECENMSLASTLLLDLFEIFEKKGIKATWFVVGKDLIDPQYKQSISQLVDNGHEIGNHTMSHKRNFHLLSYQEKIIEIMQCHRLIEKIGYTPVGFRTPYFAWDVSTMQILENLRYCYDSSLFPCSIYPLINTVKNILNANLASGTKAYRNNLIYSSRIKQKINCVAEIPISVSSKLKLPLHASYSLTLPYELAKKYTWRQINMYKKSKEPFVYVIHLNDICPSEYLKSREFKLYMSQNKRIDFLEWVCSQITQSFKTTTTKSYVWQSK